MKIELKDVIHLYLGCEVEYEGITNGKELKAEMDANKHDVFYLPTIEKNLGVKHGYLKEIRIDAKGNKKYLIGRKGLQRHYNTDRFKPILRPLSDMREDDIAGWSNNINIKHTPYCVELDSKRDDGEFTEIYPDGSILSRSKDDGEIRPINGGLLFTILLKQGFDLFNLISTGQAIDKSTK